MKQTIRLCLLVIFLVGGSLGAGVAQQGAPPPGSTGLITHEIDPSASPDSGLSLDEYPLAEYLEPGFPVKSWLMGGVYIGGPNIHIRVGNIDADPQLEILTTGISQGPLHAWNYDGTIVPGWPRVFMPRVFYPALGNLSDLYPGMEIFTGQLSYRLPQTPPGPMLLYSGGGELLSPWPKDSENDIWVAPILADLNSDGLDEIIIYEGAQALYAYRPNGELLPGWPIPNETGAYCVGDLDKDGDLEIVTFDDSTSDGAYMLVYHHTGERLAGFSTRRITTYKRSRPLIGDVDGDGTSEIITYDYGFLPNHLEGRHFLVLVIAPDGTIEQYLQAEIQSGWDICENSEALALSDLDQDGNPEIIAASDCGIKVFNGDGTVLDGWPVLWSEGSSTYGAEEGGPVVADLDGDQILDILNLTWIRDLRGNNAEVRIYDRFGYLNPKFPITLPLGFPIMPAVADIDLDGRNELLIGSDYWDGIVEEHDKVWVYDLGGNPHGKVDWGQLGGGPQNWNLYPPPPTYSGSNVYLAGPAQTSASLEEAGIPVRYGNHGVAKAEEVVLTLTLDDGITYLRDSSGISPTINGPVITWVLPDIGFRIERQFGLVVGLPFGTSYGDTFSVNLQLDHPGREADPSDDAQQITLVVAKQTYLPAITR